MKTLVTSALPYVNNVPHLGNLMCVISADVYTRFLRLKNQEVISVLGTDEHGTTTETKAIEEGLTPKEVCDKYYKIHKEIYDWFECEFDCFGRTSSKENAEITIDIFNKLYKNGYITEGIIEQLYCEKDKRFLADRFVEGTCPKCNYENARGDQCENCGSLLNATELVNPKCKICKSKPIVKQSNHLFIDLPKLEPELKTWISSVESKWSDNARTLTHAWFKEGLKQRCITRDLKWGIPVPLKGFEDKVFYSWFDAPIGYIGITKECRKDWKEMWFDNKTKLVQFMGKDNIPFHTILFPAFLIGTKDNYTLMKEISVNEFLNYENGQFSKSRNLGVFGDDVKSTGISADVFRYYLMINRPEKQDTEFLWSDFQKKNNTELVANLGNLVNRTLSFLNRFYDSTIPDADLNTKDEEFLEEVKKLETKISELAESINIKEALKEIMRIATIGNRYLQENEPWKNPDEKRKSTCLNVLANVVKDLSILVFPYMPGASARMQLQLNIASKKWDDLGQLLIKKGHKINTAEILFRKIEDEEITSLQKEFSGKKKENFADVDLKTAKIISVEDHPNAESLYVLKVECNGERQLVAGLKKYYSKEELLGKNIVIVANLKPAKLRGIESQGMLLAADDGKKVGVVLHDDLSGKDVFAEGIVKKPLKEIEINYFAKFEIKTDGKNVFADGLKLKTEKAELIVDRAVSGKVR